VVVELGHTAPPSPISSPSRRGAAAADHIEELITLPTVPLRDIEVHYTCSGSGPAVVFVHGLAEDHRSWQRQQRELPDYRTFAYDLRGHGATTLGEADGKLEQLRDDLLAFLDEVSGPAVCVGFSLGGTVVLSAAASGSELVRGAVAMATSSVVGRAAASFFAERAEQLLSGGPEEVAAALRADTRSSLVREPTDLDDLVRQRQEAVGDGRGYANAAEALVALRESPLTPHLGTISCPVAVIGADQDQLCPRKAADILLEAVPHARYHEIPQSGHLMKTDNPDAVTATLRDVLAEMR
jgi:3-oxoadipate enol-lactonase